MSKASFVNEKERAVYNKNKIDLTLIVQRFAFWLIDFSAQFLLNVNVRIHSLNF